MWLPVSRRCSCQAAGGTRSEAPSTHPGATRRILIAATLGRSSLSMWLGLWVERVGVENKKRRDREEKHYKVDSLQDEEKEKTIGTSHGYSMRESRQWETSEASWRYSKKKFGFKGYYGAWSWCLRFFMISSLMILAETIWIQLSLRWQNSKKKKQSRLERNLTSRKGNLDTKNARSEIKELVSGIRLKLLFFLFFFSFRITGFFYQKISPLSGLS